MNRIYRVVYNAHTQTHQAVSEHGKGRHKTQSCLTQNGTTVSAPARIRVPFLPTAIIGALLAFTGISTAQAAPQGGEVVRGAATISQQGKLTDIHQTTPKAAINWQKFGIKHDETVQFRQPDTRSIMLNRVIGNERSVIDGALRANGKVFVLNPHGTLIGNGAKINVGGLLASSADMDNDEFMAGNFRLYNAYDNRGAIKNHGNITVPEGGTVALIAPIVKNHGNITTPKGNTLFASGDNVTVTFSDDNFSYQVDYGLIQGLVENGGAIFADGGRVVLTAQGADAIKKSLIKHTGIIRANTVQNKNGVIELLSDDAALYTDTEISGSLKAEATGTGNGGNINIKTNTMNMNKATTISTLATNGKDGTLTINIHNLKVDKENAPLDGQQVSNFLKNNNVILQSNPYSDKDLTINDPIIWNKNKLTLKGKNNNHINNKLTGLNNATLGLHKQDSSFSYRDTPYSLGKNGKISLPSGQTLEFKIGNYSEETLVNVFSNDKKRTKQDFEQLFNKNTASVANHSFKNMVVLGSDFDMSDTANWGNNFAGFETNQEISTEIHGLGNTIKNFTVNTTEDNVGFLRNASYLSIRDLNLENINIHGKNNVGGLIGYVNANGSDNNIQNINIFGKVSGNNTVGGIIGKAHVQSYGISGYNGMHGNININQSIVKGTLIGSNDVGGFIGNLYAFGGGGYIEQSQSQIDIHGNKNIGGLIGNAEAEISTGHGSSIQISQSYTSGSITGKQNIGGFVGYNKLNAFSGLISNFGNFTSLNSYSSAYIQGNENVGGIIGYSKGNNNTPSIYNNYIFGKVNGDRNYNPFIGKYAYTTYQNGQEQKADYKPTIFASFYDTQTTGIKSDGSSAAKTTAQMKQQATYQDQHDPQNIEKWDFQEIWRIDEGKDYPRLRALTEGKITIAADKSDLSVQAPNVSKTYDGVPIKNVEDLKALKGWGKGISVTGLLDNDTAASGLKNLTIDPTRGGWVGAVDVKKDGYDLYPIADVSDNFKQKYEIDWQKGILMINPKTLEIIILDALKDKSDSINNKKLKSNQGFIIKGLVKGENIQNIDFNYKPITSCSATDPICLNRYKVSIKPNTLSLINSKVTNYDIKETTGNMIELADVKESPVLKHAIGNTLNVDKFYDAANSLKNYEDELVLAGSMVYLTDFSSNTGIKNKEPRMTLSEYKNNKYELFDKFNDNQNNKENKNSGLQMAVYRDQKNNKYVITYRGSEEFNDWITNFETAAKVPSQYRVSLNKTIDFIEKIKRQNPNAHIVLTGHSLGGSLAQYNAGKLSELPILGKQKIELVTFNTAPLRFSLLKDIGLIDGNQKATNKKLDNISQVTHFIFDNDMLSQVLTANVGDKGYLKGANQRIGSNKIKIELFTEGFINDHLEHHMLSSHETLQALVKNDRKIRTEIIKENTVNLDTKQNLKIQFPEFSHLNFQVLLAGKKKITDAEEVIKYFENNQDKFKEVFDNFLKIKEIINENNLQREIAAQVRRERDNNINEIFTISDENLKTDIQNAWKNKEYLNTLKYSLGYYLGRPIAKSYNNIYYTSSDTLKDVARETEFGIKIVKPAVINAKHIKAALEDISFRRNKTDTQAMYETTAMDNILFGLTENEKYIFDDIMKDIFSFTDKRVPIEMRKNNIAKLEAFIVSYSNNLAKKLAQNPENKDNLKKEFNAQKELWKQKFNNMRKQHANYLKTGSIVGGATGVVVAAATTEPSRTASLVKKSKTYYEIGEFVGEIAPDLSLSEIRSHMEYTENILDSMSFEKIEEISKTYDRNLKYKR